MHQAESHKRRLDALNASQSMLAGLVGWSGAAVSSYFKQITNPDLAMLQRIERALLALETLAQQAAPLPLDFSQVGQIKQCLQSLQDGSLLVQVSQVKAPERPRCYSVRFSNGLYFLRRDKTGRISQTMNFTASGIMTEAIAHVIVSKLAGEQHPGATVIENKYADADSIALELEMVWPEVPVEEGSCRKS
jgi:predicted transcriptional regulator